jgi:flavin-binding protein dodecin
VSLPGPDVKPVLPAHGWSARNLGYWRQVMAVARVTEISSTSSKSFDDAIAQGIARATKTLRNVTSAWVKEQRVEIVDNRVTQYQVNMLVTFVLDD